MIPNVTIVIHPHRAPFMTGDVEQMLSDIKRADPTQPTVFWIDTNRQSKMMEGIRRDLEQMVREQREAREAARSFARAIRPRMRPIGFSCRGPWDRCR